MAYLLHHLLTKSAADRPDRTAVRFKEQELTYAHLDRASNQVARTLREIGVRRGDRVGLFVHKSIASVVGVFGILKAGAVYVPLDTTAPALRLARMTRDCDVSVLLVSTDTLAAIRELCAHRTSVRTAVVVDNLQPAPARLPSGLRVVSWNEVRTRHDGPLPSVGVIETDLAYVLYTSGSTGTPKGVMIAHRTVMTFINWCHDTFRMTQDDRVTSHAALHFDLSTFDLYVTIKAGGTVVIVPEDLAVIPARLVRLLQDERITVTYLVPSVLSLMISYGQLRSHNLSALRAVLFAGEVFPLKHLRQLVAALPHVDFYNLYGPTETNVCTYHKVRPGDIAEGTGRPLPIGVACDNTEVFAVDEHGRVVEQSGQEGELWVRGSCIAQGYWNDPEKTAAVFVRNPFRPFVNELAYRTGDIVTLDQDGVTWLYRGRRDRMIKSRGYRIELGEIESALYTCDGVKDAAVVAVPDDVVGHTLKAVVVPFESAGLTVKQVQSHCGRRLPRYMVPHIVEFRDDLPKTSTGKINRASLAR